MGSPITRTSNLDQLTAEIEAALNRNLDEIDLHIKHLLEDPTTEHTVKAARIKAFRDNLMSDDGIVNLDAQNAQLEESQRRIAELEQQLKEAYAATPTPVHTAPIAELTSGSFDDDLRMQVSTDEAELLEALRELPDSAKTLLGIMRGISPIQRGAAVMFLAKVADHTITLTSEGISQTEQDARDDVQRLEAKLTEKESEIGRLKGKVIDPASLSARLQELGELINNTLSGLSKHETFLKNNVRITDSDLNLKINGLPAVRQAIENLDVNGFLSGKIIGIDELETAVSNLRPTSGLTHTPGLKEAQDQVAAMIQKAQDAINK